MLAQGGRDPGGVPFECSKIFESLASSFLPVSTFTASTIISLPQTYYVPCPLIFFQLSTEYFQLSFPSLNWATSWIFFPANLGFSQPALTIFPLHLWCPTYWNISCFNASSLIFYSLRTELDSNYIRVSMLWSPTNIASPSPLLIQIFLASVWGLYWPFQSTFICPSSDLLKLMISVPHFDT